MDNSIQQLYRQTIQALNNANIEDSNIVALFIIEYVFSQKYVVLLSKSISVRSVNGRYYLLWINLFLAFLSVYFNENVRNNQYYVSEGVLILGQRLRKWWII